MQNADGAAAATAAQRQQQVLVQVAAMQRDTAASISLLHEAVLRLTQHTDTVNDRVRRLENWEVAQQLNTSTWPIPRPAETHRDRDPTTSPRTPPAEAPTGTQEGRDGRWGDTCDRMGHLAQYCPGDRDVTMPSASRTKAGTGPACWPHVGRRG